MYTMSLHALVCNPLTSGSGPLFLQIAQCQHDGKLHNTLEQEAIIHMRVKLRPLDVLYFYLVFRQTPDFMCHHRITHARRQVTEIRLLSGGLTLMHVRLIWERPAKKIGKEREPSSGSQSNESSDESVTTWHGPSDGSACLLISCSEWSDSKIVVPHRPLSSIKKCRDVWKNARNLLRGRKGPMKWLPPRRAPSYAKEQGKCRAPASN
jgi:hypothetical protein